MKYTTDPLPSDYVPEDFIPDWGQQSGSNLMYLNKEVQAFLKRHIPCGGTYSAGQIEFTNYEDEVIFRVPLASVVYKISIDFPVPAYILDSESSCKVPLSIKTIKSEIGSSETEEVFEDHEYTIEVQQGAQSYELKKQGTLISNTTENIDIRTWLAMGDNTVRVVATGVVSGVQAVRTLRINVTSMYLKSSFPWWTPIVYGNDYYLSGLYLYATARKVLHTTISADHSAWTFSQEDEISASTNYVSTAYRGKLDFSTQGFPTDTDTGTMTIWMTVGSQSSTVYQYKVALLRDSSTPLIIINDVDEVVNYMQSTPFNFAVFNATEATIYSTVKYGTVSYDLPVVPYVGLSPNTKIPYTVTLEEIIETEYPIYVDFTAKVNATTYDECTCPMDNSYSFPPTAGAIFVLNPAQRNNTDQPTVVKNFSIVPGVPATYSATMQNFSKVSDLWYQDSDGRKALVIPAGSQIDIPDLKPFAELTSDNGISIEFTFKLSMVAAFDDVLVSILDDTYTPAPGFSITASDIYAFATGKTDRVTQSTPIIEDTRLHVVLSLYPKFEGKVTHNLVVLYLNGIPTNSWDYTSVSRFGTPSVRLGSLTSNSDLYIYQFRVYPFALDHENVVQNWLNSMTTAEQRLKVQDDNDIIDYI